MRKILYFLYTFVCWIYVASATLVLFIPALVTSFFAHDLPRHCQRWARIWAMAIVNVCRIRIHVDGVEQLAEWRRRGAMVITCNHSSILDIPILLAGLPGDFAFVSKVEVFSIPIIGPWIQRAGFIPLKRGDHTRSEEALTAAVAAVRQGRSLLMFPEGTRTADGSLGAFKRGALVIAVKSGVPVLPVAIHGSHELFPRNSLLARPGWVSLRVGDPIDVGACELSGGGETIRHASERVRAATTALLERPDRRPLSDLEQAQRSLESGVRSPEL